MLLFLLIVSLLVISLSVCMYLHLAREAGMGEANDRTVIMRVWVSDHVSTRLADPFVWPVMLAEVHVPFLSCRCFPFHSRASTLSSTSALSALLAPWANFPGGLLFEVAD